MNHQEKSDTPAKPASPNLALLVILFVILSMNVIIGLEAWQQHSITICYLIITMSVITIVSFAGYLIINKRLVTQLEMATLRQQEKATKELNERLTYEMQALGIHNEKMTLLIELSDIVQACVNIHEATKAIEVKCKRILHFADGALYIKNLNKDILECTIKWGEPVDHLDLIKHDQCWALRKGGFYQVKNPQTDLTCEHLIGKNIVPYVCIPLMAQNTIFGLLHLDFSEDNTTLTDENHILVSAVTETLGLALANISLRETLRNQSLHDSLTGLYNRRYLDEFLFKEINLAKRAHFSVALVMLDIDFFKQFNDNYGHEAGDLVLQEFGKFLQQEVRATDICCRYGGEEFLCVLHDCDLENAKYRAEEMRSKLATISISYKYQRLENITASFGIAIYPDDETSVAELIEAADKALYHAKKTSRNTVIAFSEVPELKNAE